MVAPGRSPFSISLSVGNRLGGGDQRMERCNEMAGERTKEIVDVSCYTKEAKTVILMVPAATGGLARDERHLSMCQCVTVRLKLGFFFLL